MSSLSTDTIEITTTSPAQWPDIWPIVESVIKDQNSYSFDPTWQSDDAKQRWFAPDKTVFVAKIDNQIAGTFYIRPNFEGPASHIANAGFMVSKQFRGRGIARTMGTFALQQAKAMGFTALQFNLVLASNTHALNLWQSLGFNIIGTIPNAYHHKTEGLVDAHIMYQAL